MTATSPASLDAGAPGQRSGQPERLRRGEGGPLTVGLVNNMPDAALRATERQFRELLSAAWPEQEVELRFFSLPSIPRTDSGHAHIRQKYQDFEELRSSPLDGLIVTGTEPRAASLADEPYWPELTGVVDWARENAVPTIWSCLAAHAAVLHLDGIGRRALRGKLSGVFDCVKAADHALTANLPHRWRVPHSRYNGLPGDMLAASGYDILAASPLAGADMFVRQGGTPFLFLQGHPEYDAGALLREYRRDVCRFLAGERESYPAMPCGYFGEAEAAALAACHRRALQARSLDLLATIDAAVSIPTSSWRESAVQLYAAWLRDLAKRRTVPPITVGAALFARDAGRELLRG